MFADLLTDPQIQTNTERTMDFHFPKLQPGVTVGVRYKFNPTERYGNIVAIRAMGDAEKRGSTAPYGVLEILMEDGSIRYEHPAHLLLAKPLVG